MLSPRLWPSPDVVVMPRSAWKEAASNHRQRVLRLLGRSEDGHSKANENSSRRHPVLGFLYEYYHFKPSTILSWTPGLLPHPLLLQDALPPYETVLTAGKRRDSGVSVIRRKGGVVVRLQRQGGEGEVVGTMFVPLGDNGGVTPTPASRHRQALEQGREVLRATLERPPGLHCFGVHEWALMYWKGGQLGPKGLGQGPGGGLGQGPGRADRVGPRGGTVAKDSRTAEEGVESVPKVLYEQAGSYESLPLRLSQVEINDFVESRLPLQCTHWDAYRFFALDALPLNTPRLTSQDQVAFEQPGCIHTNGDLLKWALKVRRTLGVMRC